MITWIKGELTFSRWRSNPFQMFATAYLGIWAILQIADGPTTNSALSTEVDRFAQVFVSSTNLFGAIICMVGLHMRDLGSALWVEVIGYVSLLGSLGLYAYLVWQKTGGLNSAPGYGLVCAFCSAGVYRTVQIFRLKNAERRAEELRQLVNRVDPGPESWDDDDG